MAKRLKEVPKTKLVSITIPEDWWEAAAKLAKSRGCNRSELVRDLIQAALPESDRLKLSEPVPHGRPSVQDSLQQQ